MTTIDGKDPVQQALDTLWQRNFLNLRAATQGARARSRTRLDVGFELAGAALSEDGRFHEHAVDCLRYLSSCSNFNLFLWTYAPQAVVMRVTTSLLLPNQIKVKGVNENKISVSVDRDPRKPYFDVLLDPVTGFDPLQGHWYWAHRLFEIAEETLRTQMSGLHVIHSRDKFDINPPSKVFQNPQFRP
ncbi:MAG: hypothetical protein H0W78_02975 [Planctomycetes bacterium]|nr:hypothetical protein [Planctomycetota bacterium]